MAHKKLSTTYSSRVCELDLHDGKAHNRENFRLDALHLRTTERMHPIRAHFCFRTIRATALLLSAALLAEMASAGAITFKVAGSEPESDRYASCRSLLVGPWKNQPDEYEGYNGFVGWSGVTRLRSGRWLLTFTSGSWHATPPWTDEVRSDPANLKQFEEWKAIGMPDVRAPRGGRAHIMHSDDEGRTWSKPRTLVDTEDDDRHPSILELDDGTLIANFFSYRYPGVYFAKYMRSSDGGETWTEPLDPLGKPTPGAFGNGPIIQLKDGTVLWVAEGPFDSTVSFNSIGVMRSEDRGKTFQLASVVKRDHDLNEPTVAEMPDGRLALIIRKQGDLCFSSDGGRTWEATESPSWELFDPHVLQLPNGVLACFHGSYKKGGIRVLLSPDGGKTWNGPGEGYGYSVDPSVYGYSHPMILPDGTVYIVYLHTGGHTPHDARTEAIWGLRLRVRDDASGIEILPAPGSDAEHDALEKPVAGSGGDPVLGDKL
jgi:photosystem II stability/assembly factor-like uncharacterized protein